MIKVSTWKGFDVEKIFFFEKKNIIKVYQKSGTELIGQISDNDWF